MNDAAVGVAIISDATPTEDRPGGWADALRWAILAVVVSRLLVWMAGLLAIAIWGVHDLHALTFDRYGLTRPFGELGNELVGPAARWDSVWFLRIAQDGYAADANRAAFFPLYPALIAMLAPVFGPLLAGLFISLASFVGAMTLFFRLVQLELGTAAARWGVMALVLFPGSFWFSSVYSESLFLLLSVGAVLAAREQRWLAAGAIGALAAATRSAGVLLAIPIALLWWDARRGSRKPASLAGLAAAPAVLAGLLATCVAFASMGRGFLAPFNAQDTWNRGLRGPWAGLADGTSAAFDGARQLLHGRPPPLYFEQAGADPMAVARHNVLLWITLVVAVVLLVEAVRRLRLAHSAYAAAALLLPLSFPVAAQPLMSLPRFVSVLYPLFMVAGLWLARGSRPRAVSVLAVSAAGLMAVSALVTDWRWVA